MASYISSFPNGFSKSGVIIRGQPVLNSSSGRVFWVDNSALAANDKFKIGSDGNKGNYDSPFATLNYAMTVARANKGDIIYVKAGHAEKISSATAMTWGTAGVAIVGLGFGSNRPTFTLDTANTSTITVSAANISVTNCIFVANFLAIAVLFTLTTAKDFTIDNCEIKDTSNVLDFLGIVSTNATANAADGLSIVNNIIKSTTAAGVNYLFTPGAALDRLIIDNNYYTSLSTNSAALIPASTYALTNFLLTNNKFNITNATGTATGYIMTGTGASTGFVHNNFDHALPTSPLLITAGTGLVYGLNYHSDTADQQGYLVPVADS